VDFTFQLRPENYESKRIPTSRSLAGCESRFCISISINLAAGGDKVGEDPESMAVAT